MYFHPDIAKQVILYAATRTRPTFQWLSFFAVQGPAVLLEASIARRWGASLHPPGLAPILRTLCVLLAVASALFFPPVAAHALDQRVVTAVLAALS